MTTSAERSASSRSPRISEQTAARRSQVGAEEADRINGYQVCQLPRTPVEKATERIPNSHPSKAAPTVPELMM